MLRITCPECSASYRVAEAILGQDVSCAKCGTVFKATDEAPAMDAMEAPREARSQREAEEGPRARPGPAGGPSPTPARASPTPARASPAAGRPSRVGEGRPRTGTGRDAAAGPPAPARPSLRGRIAARSRAAEGDAPTGRSRLVKGSRLRASRAEDVDEAVVAEEQGHGRLRGRGRQGPVGHHGHHGPPKPLFLRYPGLTIAVCGGALLGVAGLITLLVGGGDGTSTRPGGERAADAEKPSGPAAPPPAIRMVTPEKIADQDVANGASVTVLGTDFQLQPGIQVLFGLNPSPKVQYDASAPQGERIQAEVPPGRGDVIVKVRNPDGQESNGISFTYIGEVRVPFNPDTDLLGYRQASVHPYVKWIVDLKPFEARRGEMITLKERDRVRELWEKSQEVYESEMAAMGSDPRLKEAYRIAERLHTQHEYFKKVDFFIAVDLPFAYYLQRPPQDDPNYKKDIVAKFGSLLQELRRVFEKEYVEKLGLKRHLEPEVYCIAILATRGNYAEDFASAMGLGQGGLRLTAAHYDPKSRIAVTYEDKFTPLSSDQERRNAVLHEFVHAMQNMYCSSGDGMPKPVWFNEGLAEYRAADGPQDMQTLWTPPVPAKRFRDLVQILGSDMRNIFIANLKDLVGADGPGYRDVIQGAANRASGGAPVPVGGEQFVGNALGAFYAQSAVAVHFFHQGAGGKYRDGFLKYFKAVQGGESGWEPFTRAFEGVDPRQIEKDYFAFIRQMAPSVPEWTPKWPEDGTG